MANGLNIGFGQGPKSLVASALSYGTFLTRAQTTESGGGGGGGGNYSQVLNFPNFSSTTNLTFNSGARVIGTSINPAYTTSGHQAGTVWWNNQVNIANGFDTTFTIGFTPGGTLAQQVAYIQNSQNGAIHAFSFMVQNSSAATLGPTCPGSQFTGLGASADANMAAFGGYTAASQCPIGASIAVKMDLSPVNGQSQAFPSVPSLMAHTGVYMNYGPLAALIPTEDMTNTGISFYTGGPFACRLTYDRTYLTFVCRDTSTAKSYRRTWAISIPNVIGSNNAWIGFGAGLGISCIGQQLVNNWTFGTGNFARLAGPAIMPATGQYTSSQIVSISAPAGASIFYTINGCQPTSTDISYTGPFTVSTDTIVQAIAIESGFTDSFVTSSYIQIRASTTPTINLSSFTSNLVQTVGSAIIVGGGLQITDGSNSSKYFNQAGAGWFPVPVNISSFHGSFTFTANGNGNGFVFCIQNQSTPNNSNYQWISGGPNTVSSCTGLGYSGSTGEQNVGILNSIAIKFDIFSGNTTGLLTNAAQISTINTAIGNGVSIASGHLMRCDLAYDGTTLTWTITDTVTSATWSTNQAVNIPSIVGGNAAFIGFTGGTGGAIATQTIKSLTFGA